MHPSGLGRSIRKIDNVLTSQRGLGIVFQKVRQATLALPVNEARYGFGVKDEEWLGNGAASH